MIGTFGPIVFETSDRRILTFRELGREVAGRWASHTVIGVKPKKEFLGAEAQSITFTVRLSATHGVRPRATLDTIANLVETGQTHTLIIGQRPVGLNPFALVSCSESWDQVLSGGELVAATVSLTLEEYL